MATDEFKGTFALSFDGLLKAVPSSSRVYLATPYTDPDPAVMEARFQKINRVAGRLMEAGRLVFSPISHTHPIAVAHALPREWEFWRRYDLSFISGWATNLVVYCTSGWQFSVGVNAEMELAYQSDIPVNLLEATHSD